MANDRELLEVGRISSAHGIKGFVKIHSYTDPVDNILDYQPWFLSTPTGWEEVKVTADRMQGKSLVVRINDTVDRTEAENTLIGRRIAVLESVLPELEGDEFYWRELIGLRVRTLEGVDLGTVTSLIETGANDVLVVRGDSHSLDLGERLLPWVLEQVITEVDLSAGTMTVDWDPDF